MSTEAACQNCKFWLKSPPKLTGGNARGGYCRRHPPRTIRLQDGSLLLGGPDTYPYTLGSQWCGEFRPRHGEAQTLDIQEAADQ